MEENILEKAKKLQKQQKGGNRRVYTLDDYELAWAWLNGSIGTNTVKKVLGKNTQSSVYAYIALSLKEGFRDVLKDRVISEDRLVKSKLTTK